MLCSSAFLLPPKTAGSAGRHCSEINPGAVRQPLCLTMRLTSSTACPRAVAWNPDVIIAAISPSRSRPRLKSYPEITAVSGIVLPGTSTASCGCVCALTWGDSPAFT